VTSSKSDDSDPGDSGDERKPYLLRLPASLLNELRGWAAQDLRSLNAHLEFLLRDAVRRHKREKAQM
jgi:hypothetical protein